MPVLVMTGQPGVGKTRAARAIARALTDAGVRAHIINEENLGIHKGEAYAGPVAEKMARGSVLSAFDRALDRDSCVIVDTGNGISGYRYQLYCLAREAATTYAVLAVVADKSTAAARNAARKGGAKFTEAQFEDLWQRYEPPNTDDRWDTPLFTIGSAGLTDGLGAEATPGMSAAPDMAGSALHSAHDRVPSTFAAQRAPASAFRRAGKVQPKQAGPGSGAPALPGVGHDAEAPSGIAQSIASGVMPSGGGLTRVRIVATDDGAGGTWQPVVIPSTVQRVLTAEEAAAVEAATVGRGQGVFFGADKGRASKATDVAPAGSGPGASSTAKPSAASQSSAKPSKFKLKGRISGAAKSAATTSADAKDSSAGGASTQHKFKLRPTQYMPGSVGAPTVESSTKAAAAPAAGKSERADSVDLDAEGELVIEAPCVPAAPASAQSASSPGTAASATTSTAVPPASAPAPAAAAAAQITETEQAVIHQVVSSLTSGRQFTPHEAHMRTVAAGADWTQSAQQTIDAVISLVASALATASPGEVIRVPRGDVMCTLQVRSKLSPVMLKRLGRDFMRIASRQASANADALHVAFCGFLQQHM